LIRLCSICARAGSKGVVNKNVRLLGGRPLIAHSVVQAVDSGLFDHVAVSSDSNEILAAARDAGADLLVTRPEPLASDQAAKLPAIRHCVEQAERMTGKRFESLVDLDATSPLRSVSDIRGVVELLEEGGGGIVITAAPARRSPYFNLVELRPDGSVGLSKPPPDAIVRRQDAPPCYDMNASIYGWRRNLLFEAASVFTPETRLFVMPVERSIDIDSELDFVMVEFLMGRSAGSSND
jgi:CMP-N,N'-diacetyllegionaminic acid synthase